MNPVVSYIKQTLQGYYPDSELVPMAKLLLTNGMSVVESWMIVCIKQTLHYYPDTELVMSKSCCILHKTNLAGVLPRYRTCTYG